jgi:hypothetical protein
MLTIALLDAPRPFLRRHEVGEELFGVDSGGAMQPGGGEYGDRSVGSVV